MTYTHQQKSNEHVYSSSNCQFFLTLHYSCNVCSVTYTCIVEYQKFSLKSLMEISNTCCLEYIQRLIDEISLQVKFCIVLYTWSCSWLSCCNLQTHAVENAESAEVKECRAEEAGVGRTTGREETEASTEGPRYTVWYVFL